MDSLVAHLRGLALQELKIPPFKSFIGTAPVVVTDYRLGAENIMREELVEDIDNKHLIALICVTSAQTGSRQVVEILPESVIRKMLDLEAAEVVTNAVRTRAA